MDRVVTLSERLQEQLAKNASLDELMMTVQMLQSELSHLKSSEVFIDKKPAYSLHLPEIVVMPNLVEETNLENQDEKEVEINQVIEEEKVVHVLHLDEVEIEAELDEIKKSAAAKISASIKNKPVIQFDPIEDIPTLIHQKSNNEILSNATIKKEKEDSVNNKLKLEGKEISDSFSEAPIKDLKKAIGINDRFLFINELFLGDEVMYERSIKTINAFSIYPEAEYWIRRELKLKLGWIENSDAVKQFNQLVKRRFNFI